MEVEKVVVADEGDSPTILREEAIRTHAKYILYKGILSEVSYEWKPIKVEAKGV